VNTVSLIGRLTRDVELRHSQGGTTFASFGLAVDRAGDRNDDGSYGAGFFDVTLFGKTAELAAQYLAKGKQVGITGSLRFHQWATDDGAKRSKVEIAGQSMTFCGSKDDGNGSTFTPAAGTAGEPSSMHPSAADDDIPF
jgi:single-strand DNA-binding protein